MSDTPERQAGAEVEVTPEMVEAGTEALFDFLPDVQIGAGADAELVSKIFRQMHRRSVARCGTR